MENPSRRPEPVIRHDRYSLRSHRGPAVRRVADPPPSPDKLFMMRCLAHVLVGVAVLLPLAGCQSLGLGANRVTPIAIRLETGDAARSVLPAGTVERAWLGSSLTSLTADEGPARRRIDLRLTDAQGQAVRRRTLSVPQTAVGKPASNGSDAASAVALVLDQPGASFTFTRGETTTGGVVRIAFRDDFIAAASAFQPRPALDQMIEAAALGLDGDLLRRFLRLPVTLTLAHAIQLTAGDVTPEAVRRLHEAGYRLSVADLVRLQEAGVSIDAAVTLRDAGLNYSVNELIALQRAGVVPGYAIAMQATGYGGDATTVLRLHRGGVSTGYAARMRSLGVAQDADGLLRLHNANITPASVATLQQAGYDLPIDTLIALHQAGVEADDVRQLHTARYDFTPADLISLRKWQVPTAYMLALTEGGFEPLTADEIIDLHLRRITPAMVHSLRQPRRGPTTAGGRDVFELEGALE